MMFLIDAQLPPALCGWLRERGHEAVHVFDVGMVAASDDEIAARAEADDAVLVSQGRRFRHPAPAGPLRPVVAALRQRDQSRVDCMAGDAVGADRGVVGTG